MIYFLKKFEKEKSKKYVTCMIDCKNCPLNSMCKGCSTLCNEDGRKILKRQLPYILNTISYCGNLHYTKVRNPFSGNLPVFIPHIRINEKFTFYWLTDPYLKEELKERAVCFFMLRTMFRILIALF